MEERYELTTTTGANLSKLYPYVSKKIDQVGAGTISYLQRNTISKYKKKF